MNQIHNAKQHFSEMQTKWETLFWYCFLLLPSRISTQFNSKLVRRRFGCNQITSESDWKLGNEHWLASYISSCMFSEDKFGKCMCCKYKLVSAFITSVCVTNDNLAKARLTSASLASDTLASESLDIESLASAS